MSLGPLNILRRKPNPVHSALRRDIGICAGVTAVVHTVLGLQVHMGGTISRYFVPDASLARDTMLFVTTNYLGLIAAVVLMLLVLISNNKAIAGLGLAPWKRLQRLAYLVSVVVIIHGALYQAIEKRAATWVSILALVSIWTIGIQVRGFARRVSGNPPQR